MALFTRPQEPTPSGTRRAVATRYDAPRAVTASASRLDLSKRNEVEKFRKRRSAESWQSLAWEYYDAVGEVKYAFGLMAAVTSRVRLYIGVMDESGDTPKRVYLDAEDDGVDGELLNAIKTANAALARLTAENSLANFLRDASLNMSVAGECYLVQQPELVGDKVPEKWTIMSVDQVKVDASGKARIKPSASTGAQDEDELDTTKAFVGRIWRNHPRFSEDADSSMRGILELCDELLILNRAARAIERSRLNAGAMYLPDGLSIAGQPDVTGDEDPDDPALAEVDEEGDDFEQELLEAMTMPIKDEDAASAVVPLIIRGPADLADKIKIFKFERSFDEQMVARAERVIERILVGIDVPKDAITGLANVKYANAVQITESLYRAHVEPMAVLICDSLTQVYLRQVLRAAGFTPEVIRKVVFWYDPSDIVIKPDKSASADAGFDRNALSARTWRETHGFDETDAPTEAELVTRVALERGQLSQEITDAVFRRLDPQLMADVKAQNQADSPAPIPSDVQDVLDGAPGEPVDATAPDPGGRPEEPADTVDPRAPQTERDSAPVS